MTQCTCGVGGDFEDHERRHSVNCRYRLRWLWAEAFSEACTDGVGDDVYFIGDDETMITAAARLSYRAQELWREIARDSGLLAVANALGIRPEWR